MKALLICTKSLVTKKNFFFFIQGDLDRQRLLGDRPRANLYENIIEEGIEGIEHQER